MLLLFSNALKFLDDAGICRALISAEASDYIRERIRPFIDILRTIFGDEEFADTDSSTMEQGFFNARLDIFNRFAEKVSVYSLQGIATSKLYFRVTVLLLVSTPTSSTIVARVRSTTARGRLTFAKRRWIHQNNTTL